MTFNLVIGMHRSGTSLVAGLLHNFGINMGKDHFKPKPNKANPKGFYEDIRFRQVNDKLLKFNRYNVKAWKTSITTMKLNRSLKNEIRRVTNEIRDNTGSKDPRYCLTWHVWKPFLPPSTRVIYVYRNPLEVTNSLIKRGNIETVDQGLDLWRMYNQQALPIMANFKTIFVEYKTVLETGRIPGTEIKDVKNLIDFDLHRNVNETVPENCMGLWQTLKFLDNSDMTDYNETILKLQKKERI